MSTPSPLHVRAAVARLDREIGLQLLESRSGRTAPATRCAPAASSRSTGTPTSSAWVASSNARWNACQRAGYAPTLLSTSPPSRARNASRFCVLRVRQMSRTARASGRRTRGCRSRSRSRGRPRPWRPRRRGTAARCRRGTPGCSPRSPRDARAGRARSSPRSESACCQSARRRRSRRSGRAGRLSVAIRSYGSRPARSLSSVMAAGNAINAGTRRRATKGRRWRRSGRARRSTRTIRRNSSVCAAGRGPVADRETSAFGAGRSR